MDLYLASKRKPTKMAPKNGKKAVKSVQSNGVPALVSREMNWVAEFKQKCKTKDEQKEWARATLEVQDETGKSKKEASAKKPGCEITPDQMLERGLVLCQVDVDKQARSSRKSNVESFRAEFGPDPKVLVEIWHDLQTTNVEAARIDVTKRGVTVENYLIAFNFLKRYPKSKVQGNRFNCAKNTILKWRWYFVDRIKALVDEKIVWPKEWSDGSDVPTLLFTVDGVHFQQNEPTHGRWSKTPSTIRTSSRDLLSTTRLRFTYMTAKLCTSADRPKQARPTLRFSAKSLSTRFLLGTSALVTRDIWVRSIKS